MSRRWIRLTTALTAGAALSGSLARIAWAEPQVNAALTAGVTGRGEGSLWERTEFAGGLRGDVLLGRERPADAGFGPYVALESFAFGDVRPGAGATALLPVHELLPLVVSVGPFLRLADGAPAPGASARLFWGARPYNYYSPYSLAGGLLVGVDHTFDGQAETALVIVAQIDAALLALPVLFLVRTLGGGQGD